jgi:uncharacterized protein YbaR (Trm112 family)
MHPLDAEGGVLPASGWTSTGGAMALDPELKEVLVCPKCKGRLVFLEDQGEIHCPACRLAFAIRDGIPLMLVEEARPLA